MKERMQRMTKKAAVMLVVLSTWGMATTARAQGNHLARFDGGIGVNPVSSSAAPANQDGTLQNVNANVVRGIVPAGQVWRIADLKAVVRLDGSISVKGRGLILAGGNNVGRAPSLNLVATLICEATAPFVQHSTADTTNGTTFDSGVPLEPNGDFRIDETLRSPGGDPLPSECASPMLLIRSTGGAWLAAGILRIGNDE
jgi:hypothetical protein